MSFKFHPDGTNDVALKMVLFLNRNTDFVQVNLKVYIMSHVLVVCIQRHQKHGYVNYDQFAPNSGMACKTMQRVSVPNLRVFGQIKTELWAKQVGELSLCNMRKWVGMHSFPTNMAATI